MIGSRGDSIRQLIATDADALVLLGLPNIRYLCGFNGSDGVLFLTSETSVFLTDSRYATQAQDQVHVDQIICYKNKFSKLIEQLLQCNVKRAAFDADVMTVATFNELQTLSEGKIKWLPYTDQLRQLRAIKTTDELNSLRQAAQLNKLAFEKIRPLIKPGTAERDIALQLEAELKRLGGEVNAFDFIVASGERGALPHGIACDKLLQAGELVTIDFGTRVAGYHSDETVTLPVGEVNGNLRQIFDIVLKAHDLALEAIRPGMSLRELDAVARDYIAGKGYGDNFGHGLGHGVGLEIHEYPAVSPRSIDPLCEGMVITIEPGIYLPGIGGVRIEDTVVVTSGGYESLTSIDKRYPC